MNYWNRRRTIKKRNEPNARFRLAGPSVRPFAAFQAIETLFREGKAALQAGNQGGSSARSNLVCARPGVESSQQIVLGALKGGQEFGPERVHVPPDKFDVLLRVFPKQFQISLAGEFIPENFQVLFCRGLLVVCQVGHATYRIVAAGAIRRIRRGPA